MKQQMVKFYPVRRDIKEVLAPDKFRFNPACGWIWLQRLAFWFLGKINARVMDTVAGYTRQPAENNTLLESLLKQEENIVALLYDNPQEGYRIYMGPDDHMDLMQLLTNVGMYPLTLDAGVGLRGRNGFKWRGIPITVVPWMRGAIIVPDRVYQ